eukprot:SAG11_NODE_5874_length_1443_cov_1.308036_1_plen_104_part_10
MHASIIIVHDQRLLVAHHSTLLQHTFRKGHKVMVHVQSSWFPLVDRNPHTFTDINTCGEDAFVAATQRVYEGSHLEVLVLSMERVESIFNWIRRIKTLCSILAL